MKIQKLFAITSLTLLSFTLVSCGNNNSSTDTSNTTLQTSVSESAITDSISESSNVAADSVNESDNINSSSLSETIASSTVSNANVDANTIDDQVDIQYAKTQENTLVVFITNNSSSVIDDLEVQALYKDSSGQIIDTASDGHDMILPGYTVVSKLDAPSDYNDVEINKEIQLGVNPSYVNHSENVAINAHEGSDNIIVEITNNDTVTIEEVEYIVVFYSADQVVATSYAEDVYDVEPGKTEICEERLPDFPYDSFKVFLNQAHTF